MEIKEQHEENLSELIYHYGHKFVINYVTEDLTEKLEILQRQ